MMPRSNIEKYVNFVIGIIVTITLIGAFTQVEQLDFDEVVRADTSDSLTKENAAILYNEKITQNFRINLEGRISEYVQSVYGVQCEKDVMLDVKTDATVSGIIGVYIDLYGIADTAAVRQDVAKQFGFDAGIIQIGGGR